MDTGQVALPVNWTALHQATYDNSVEEGKILLDRPNIDVDCEDDEGWTPLHLASFYKNKEMIKMLILKGADFTKKIPINTEPGCREIKVDTSRLTPVAPVDVFEEILDDCIQFKRNSKHEIEFDYSFFTQPDPTQETLLEEDIEAQSHTGRFNKCEGMQVIHDIVNLSIGHRKLLKHPVVENFLLEKWNKMSGVFMSYIWYKITFFCLLLPMIIIEYLPGREHYDFPAYALLNLSLIHI